MTTARVAFIVGTAFSGSTLFSFLLDSLPEVTSVGEMTGVIDDILDKAGYPCSCGQRIDACLFWDKVSAEMAARGQVFGATNWETDFKVGRGRLGHRLSAGALHNAILDRARDRAVRQLPGWGNELRNIGVRNVALAESILAVSGKAVLVDASKSPRRPVLLRDLVGVQPSIIHLVRDAPAYVASAMNNTGVSLGKAIRIWNSMARQADRVRVTLPPDRWLLVRYEDLCSDPLGELARVAKFLGSPTVPPEALESWSPSEHHIRGNRMRLGWTGSITLDRSWTKRLDRSEVDRILVRTRRHRKRLGYGEVDLDHLVL